jgi:hypothetical protein
MYKFKVEFYTQKMRKFLDCVSMVLYAIQFEYMFTRSIVRIDNLFEEAQEKR